MNGEAGTAESAKIKGKKKMGGRWMTHLGRGGGGRAGFRASWCGRAPLSFAFFSPSPATELALAGEKSKHLVPRKRSRTHLGAGHETLQIVLLI